MVPPPALSGHHLVTPRVAHATIYALWALYFIVNTTRAAVGEMADQDDMLVRRTIVCVIGIGLTYGLYRILRTMRDERFTPRALTAFALCIPLAVAYAVVNYTAFYRINPTLDTLKMIAEYGSKPAHIMILDSAIDWYFLFGAWAALYLALSYAAQTREAERRAAVYQAAAQAAELRALRYQVNPHFLFNTLNSLSTLIMVGRTEAAERMILNLATFFRTSLTSDPNADVPLEEEIRLQRLYLDIEEIRFPERLQVRVDVPDALGEARVPALILQPLVENAIKYGVSRARKPVTITLRARARGEELVLSVEDDALCDLSAPPVAAQANGSTGTGLKNVRERLEARFGDRARTLWGPLKPCGFGAVLTMPLLLAAEPGATDAEEPFALSHA